MKLLNDRQRIFVQLLNQGTPPGGAYEQAGYQARGSAAEAAALRLMANPQIHACLAAPGAPARSTGEAALPEASTAGPGELPVIAMNFPSSNNSPDAAASDAAPPLPSPPAPAASPPVRSTLEDAVAFCMEVLRSAPAAATMDNPLCEVKMYRGEPYAVFPDKGKCLERLAKMLGWDRPEKVEVTAEDTLRQAFATLAPSTLPTDREEI